MGSWPGPRVTWGRGCAGLTAFSTNLGLWLCVGFARCSACEVKGIWGCWGMAGEREGRAGAAALSEGSRCLWGSGPVLFVRGAEGCCGFIFCLVRVGDVLDVLGHKAELGEVSPVTVGPGRTGCSGPGAEAAGTGGVFGKTGEPEGDAGSAAGGVEAAKGQETAGWAWRGRGAACGRPRLPALLSP